MAIIKTGTDKRITSFGARVTIKTKDGRNFTKELLDPPGSPQYPLTWSDIVEKLHLVIKNLNIPISEEHQEEIINFVNDIEKVNNVKSLIDRMIWQL